MKTDTIKWQAVFFYAALTAGLIWLASSYRILFGPLIISSLSAYLLYPLVTWISNRTEIKRRRVVLLVFILFLVLIACVVTYLIPVGISEADLLAKQLQGIPQQLESLIEDIGQVLGLELQTEELISTVETNLNQMFRPERIFRIILSSTSNIVWAIVIIITTFHLLRDWERLREWVFGFVPDNQQTQFRTLHKELKKIWQSYLRGQLLVMFFIGLLSGIGSAMIGLPNALLLGFLAGTLALIPNLGPTITTIIVALVAWTQGSSYLEISQLWITILAIAILLIVQLIEGFWLTPRIMSRRMNLHPGVVLIAIVGTLLTFGALMALIIVPTIGTVLLFIQFFYRKQAGLDPWPEPAEEIAG